MDPGSSIWQYDEEEMYRALNIVVKNGTPLATAAKLCKLLHKGIPTNCRLTKRLVSCVGSHRALDWLLSGRPVKPKEGLEAGAVTRIVACGSGLGQAVNFAHSLANMPQCSLRADRALIYSETGKFENNEEILAEWKLNHSKALLEVEEGVHITKSGDVRHKEWK